MTDMHREAFVFGSNEAGRHGKGATSMLTAYAERIEGDESAVCSPMLTECPRCKNNRSVALADPKCWMTHPPAQAAQEGPGEEDGPWAEGWAERSGATHPHSPDAADSGRVDDVSFSTVEKVVKALCRIGHTFPESQEEQAARFESLVLDLCRSVQSHFDGLTALAAQGQGECEPVDDYAQSQQGVMDAATKWWRLADANGVPGSVKWLRNDETRNVVIYTRGEYADRLIAFIHSLTNPAPPASPAGVPDRWTRAEAKLHERKTVHEWLNELHIDREEFGKPLCLLRRLRILCDRYADTCGQLSFEIRKQAGWISTAVSQPERNAMVIYWHPSENGGFPAIADEWRDEHHLACASHWLPYAAPSATPEGGEVGL